MKTNRKVPVSEWWYDTTSNYYKPTHIPQVVVNDITQLYRGKIGRNTEFVTPYKSLAEHLTKPKQPLHKRLTKLFKRKR